MRHTHGQLYRIPRAATPRGINTCDSLLITLDDTPFMKSPDEGEGGACVPECLM